VLLRLLGSDDPNDVANAAGAAALHGLAAETVIPVIRQRLLEWIENDPRVEKRETYTLAKSILRLGDAETALPIITRILNRDDDQIVSSVVRDIFEYGGKERAIPLLLEHGRHPKRNVRLTIASYVAQGAPLDLQNKVRGWWQKETDPWTKFALAFGLLESDRKPAADGLKWLSTEMPPSRCNSLVKGARVDSYDALCRLVADPVRLLPDGFRSSLFEFVDTYGFRRSTYVRRKESKSCQPWGIDKLKKLDEPGWTWMERVRAVRRGLWTREPEVQIAAAVRARSVLDPILIPHLIDLLLHSTSVEVRRAVAETLASVDPDALAAYRPEAQGEELFRGVQKVRIAFNKLNLRKKIPGPSLPPSSIR